MDENIFELVKKPRLTKDEKHKLTIVKKVINKEINGSQAARRLKVTNRQIRNLKRQVYNEGDVGIIHKNRFNEPSNKFSQKLRDEICDRYKLEFKGKPFLKYAQTLIEEGSNLSVSTIYNILAEGKIKKLRRK